MRLDISRPYHSLVKLGLSGVGGVVLVFLVRVGWAEDGLDISRPYTEWPCQSVQGFSFFSFSLGFIVKKSLNPRLSEVWI